MLETGRILTLSDGREYVIVTSTVYENRVYVYVANIENENDTKVCAYENNELIEIEDDELLDEVEELLLDDLRNS